MVSLHSYKNPNQDNTQIMVLGKLDVHMKKNEIKVHFTPYIKINSK